MAHHMAAQPGSRIGAYEILGLLGAGGMGEVYRARDTRLQREVAIKIIPDALANDAVARGRFETEARAVASLSHPNIIAIHDFGQEGTVAYAVMELLDGRTLREMLADGPLAPRKAIDYGAQIAAGLAAAHARGVVHRDLKPENVFITRDGRAKILDFGLAKPAAPFAAVDGSIAATYTPTSPGTVLGTVGYMSPEQVRGESVDHRSDIFSLGAMLYEVFSGTRAFTGPSPIETMNAILKEEPPERSIAHHALPPAIDRIVRRALEKDPAERFQSARDLGFALEALSGTSGSMPATLDAAPRWCGWLLRRSRGEQHRAHRTRHVHAADVRPANHLDCPFCWRRRDHRLQFLAAGAEAGPVRRANRRLGAPADRATRYAPAVGVVTRGARGADRRIVRQPAAVQRHARAHDARRIAAAVAGERPRSGVVG
jgi:serine/threonine protein kinase